MAFEQLKKRAARHRKEGLCQHCPNVAEEDRLMCASHLLYHRQKKREVRAERRAKGLCLQCGQPARLRLDGKTGLYCQSHYEANLERARKRRKLRKNATKRRIYCSVPKKARRSLGLCYRCGWPNPKGTAHCQDCLDKHNADRVRLAGERRARGLCHRCGRRSLKASACVKCRKILRKKHARLLAAKKAKGQCVACSRPARPNGARCQKHHDMFKLTAVKRADRQEIAATRAGWCPKLNFRR